MMTSVWLLCRATAVALCPALVVGSQIHIPQQAHIQAVPHAI